MTTPTLRKKCTVCKEDKPHSEFGPNKKGALGLMSWCRACARKKAAAFKAGLGGAEQRRRNAMYQDTWRREHPEENRAYMRKYRLAVKFGITVAQYDALLEAQGGLCAVCRKEETVIGRGGLVKPLAVDHNHVTGQVRGLLCQRCNFAIGLLADSPEHLHSAIAYLSRAEAAAGDTKPVSQTPSAGADTELRDAERPRVELDNPRMGSPA